MKPRRLLLTALLCVFAAHSQPRIPVRVVVVAMFEPGADTGDQPGEFQYRVEREKLVVYFCFPQGYRDLRRNRNGVLGVVTGVGTARAAATITPLGNDLHFDLTHAYWLVAGIAGRTGGCVARVGSVGGVGVDGDLAHGIDAREIPADWKTGYIPLRRSVPYEQPRRDQNAGEAYYLNAALVD
jgi:purine nucleoside permease